MLNNKIVSDKNSVSNQRLLDGKVQTKQTEESILTQSQACRTATSSNGEGDGTVEEII